jgi:hypothetical protein
MHPSDFPLASWNKSQYISWLTEKNINYIEEINKQNILKKDLHDLCFVKRNEFGTFPIKRANDIQHRKYDLAYHVVTEILKKVEQQNVIFTPDHQIAKEEIFGIKNNKTCILTGETEGVSKGDHKFPIRGAFKKSGRYGSISPWNTIPISSKKNSKYKLFKHGNLKKDIGFEELTDEEYNECTENEKNIYNKFIKWNDYCKKFNAITSWKFTDETNNEIEKNLEKTIQDLIQAIDNIEIKLE